MRGVSGRANRPGACAAPRNDSGAGIRSAVFESQRNGGTLRCIDQGPPCGSDRRAGIFLVPVVYHGDIQSIECTGRLQGLQRIEQNDISTFHVDDARSASGGVIQTLEPLEWARRLEHGVEMPDQQDLRAWPRMLGHEMAGAMKSSSVDPSCAEAERIELPAQDVSHRSEEHT